MKKLTRAKKVNGTNYAVVKIRLDGLYSGQLVFSDDDFDLVFKRYIKEWVMGRRSGLSVLRLVSVKDYLAKDLSIHSLSCSWIY